ncbi:major facilitator superfamily domain-containing protein, partial [Dimargaris cristalligena]
VAACLSMLGAGTVYLFSIYGPAFKTELHFSALQTSLVASAGDYGLYLSGPLWGFLVDRYGPRLPALLGGGLLLAGYSLLARLFQTASWSSAVIPPTLGTVALASLGFTLVGLGSQSAYMASMATTARNFSSQHRGVALGLPIGLFGLSAFFFSQINRLLFTPPDSPPSTTEPDEGAPSHFSPTQFLWFMALATSGAHFVAFLCLRIVPPATSTPAALITEAETETETRPPGRPEAVPMASDKRSFFRDPQALYLVLGMLGIAGTGLMYINNSGTLIDTLLPDQPAAAMKLRTRTVSLLSLCNFLARVVSGQLSDTLLRRFAVPRIALLFLAGVIMTVAQVGAAHLTSISGLDALTVAIGVAYGAVFALSPTVTSEYWGTEHLGYHWGWIVLGPAIGGHVGNSIFGLVYDAHVSGPS